jgi:hypothetical protein
MLLDQLRGGHRHKAQRSQIDPTIAILHLACTSHPALLPPPREIEHRGAWRVCPVTRTTPLPDKWGCASSGLLWPASGSHRC